MSHRIESDVGLDPGSVGPEDNDFDHKTSGFPSLAKWCDHTLALVCSPDGTPWYPAASWGRELQRREMDRTQM